MTGFLPRNGHPDSGRTAAGQRLAAAGATGAVIALAACGSQCSGSGAPGEPGTAAAQPAAPDATSMEIGNSVDVPMPASPVFREARTLRKPR